MVFASGITKKNKDGSDMVENVKRKSGCLDPKFIEKHNLSVSSQPEVLWSYSFLMRRTSTVQQKNNTLVFHRLQIGKSARLYLLALALMAQHMKTSSLFQ